MARHPRPEQTPPGAPPPERSDDPRGRVPRGTYRVWMLALLLAAVLGVLAAWSCTRRVPPGDTALTPDT